MCLLSKYYILVIMNMNISHTLSYMFDAPVDSSDKYCLLVFNNLLLRWTCKSVIMHLIELFSSCCLNQWLVFVLEAGGLNVKSL